MRGYASLVPLAKAVEVEDEVTLYDFLGWDGALEASPTRFLPIV